MATILVTWELGGGLGHLVPLAPILAELSRHGHRLLAAVRELSHIDSLFGELRVRYLQAPFKNTKAEERIDPPRTFAHILHNTGFRDPRELKAMSEAWRNLYDFVKPDLILFDHSPMALLAARTIDARRAVIGTGFCCPPDVYPLPDFRPWMPDESERLRADEDRILATINHQLQAWHVPPLGQLSQLYREVDATFLTTFAELDHYPVRARAEYYGIWSNPGGRTPTWPEAPGKRVFAYLKPFRALGELLGILGRLGLPTIVYLDPLDPRLPARFPSPMLRFEAERVDFDAAAATCDLAILNGGHGATAVMLLAGKPVLALPIHLEQALNGRALARLGAGLSAEIDRPELICSRLMTLLQRDEYALAARRFAVRYSDFDPQQSIRLTVERLEGLLAGAAQAMPP